MKNKSIINRKKVLFIESSNVGTVGGSHYSLLYLIKGLNKKTYKPVIVMYENNPMINRYNELGAEVIVMNKSINSRHTQIYNLKISKSINSFLNFLHVYCVSSINKVIWLKNNQIDLVHLNNSALIDQDWVIACRLSTIPCISHKRGITKSISYFTRLIANQVDSFICISYAVYDSMINLGFKSSKLYTVHNGIDPNDLSPDLSANELRQKYDINSSPVIGIIANIKKWKGQDIVIKSLKYIIEQYPDTKCLIVGDISGSDLDFKAELDALISSLKLTDSVIFTGFEKNIANSLSIIDIVVHASTEPEPFGRVIIEAMSMGKPVIASRIGGPCEIIDDNDNGLLHIPGDAIDLSKKILELMDSDITKSKIARNGRKNVEENFSFKKTSLKIMGIYSTFL